VAVWPGLVEESLEALRTGAEPCPTATLLSACLAEGRGANERLSRIGPAVGMGAMGVVVVQVGSQAGDKLLGRGKVATFQEASRQGTEPQFNLVEPGTVLGCEMKDVLVIGIGQESTPLDAGTQLFFVERQAVQPSHESANLETPMGVQVVEQPMEALMIGELRGDMGQMGGEIDAGACHAQIPHDLARGHDERGNQATRAVTDVLVLAFLGFARLHRNGGMLALKDLHAGFFIRADDQLALLIQDGGSDIQAANGLSFTVEVGIVAVEPVDAAMRFQVGFVEDAPDGRALHGFVGVPIDQDGGEIVEAPLAGDAVMFAGLARGQRDDFELFVGGKSSVADRNAEHPADQPDRAGDNVFAKALRCCDCSQTRWQPANSMADLRRSSARSAGNGRPEPAAWNGLGPAPASAAALRGPQQSAEQMDLACDIPAARLGRLASLAQTPRFVQANCSCSAISEMVI